MLNKENVTDKPIRRRRRNSRTGHPTVADVAAAAGVSTATVSRAINNPDMVSPVLKAKVDHMVRELGYVPSGAARALASNRSFTIGCVVPTLNDAIFSAAITACEAELSRVGYTLLVTVSNYDPAHETEQLRKLLQRGVDGVMLVGFAHDAKLWQLIESAQCPMVSIGSQPNADIPIPGIGFDNALPAREIIDHLAALGHRRIGMIAGLTAGNDRALARKNGVISGLRKHQLEVDPALFLEKPYSHEDGRKGFAELVTKADAPTAIVCGNDVLAMGCLFEAQALGVSIPDDISITGYDNLAITSHISPVLTTVDIPLISMGRDAAKSLVGHLNDGKEMQSISYEARLIVRETTAPAPP